MLYDPLMSGNPSSNSLKCIRFPATEFVAFCWVALESLPTISSPGAAIGLFAARGWVAFKSLPAISFPGAAIGLFAACSFPGPAIGLFVACGWVAFESLPPSPVCGDGVGEDINTTREKNDYTPPQAAFLCRFWGQLVKPSVPQRNSTADPQSCGSLIPVDGRRRRRHGRSARSRLPNSAPCSSFAACASVEK